MARYEPFDVSKTNRVRSPSDALKSPAIAGLFIYCTELWATFFPTPPRQISRVSFNKRDFSSEREETRDIISGHLTRFSLKADVTRWKSLRLYSTTQRQHSTANIKLPVTCANAKPIVPDKLVLLDSHILHILFIFQKKEPRKGAE